MSKKRLSRVLLPALLFLSCNLIAQSPGGIEGQSFWLRSASSSGITATNNLNFNPAIAVDNGKMNVSLPSKLNSLRRITVLTVYMGANNAVELPIWKLKGDFGDLALSTDQVSSTSGGSRLLFPSGSSVMPTGKPQPYIHTYTAFNINQHAPVDLVSDGIIQLGSNEVDKTGMTQSALIPEIICYDRILDESEIDKIESYLALKYGIGLVKNYVSSKGKIVWNYESQKSHSNNVTGIGRDDQSNLYQKQSTSSSIPGLLTIGVQPIAPSNALNQGVLNNEEYLIWGDNGKGFALANTDDNFQHLETNWVMTASGKNISSNFTQVKVDIKKLFPQLLNERVMYLVIDRTGTGDFSSTQRTYLKVDSISADGIATFNNVAWDTDGSGSDVFTFGLKNTSFAESHPNNKNPQVPFIQFQLYPNPVSNGQYKLSVNLDKPGDIIIQIYDLSYRLIETWKGSGSSTYLFSGMLKAPAGSYTVKLKTSHSELYRMLILQ